MDRIMDLEVMQCDSADLLDAIDAALEDGRTTRLLDEGVLRAVISPVEEA